MSWIIRSNTTPTSIERKVKPEARTASMNFGFRAWGVAAARAGLNRSTCPTWSTSLLSPGQFDQFVGLGHGRADGLFDEQVRACFQKIDGQAMVQHGRRGDHRRIDAAQQRAVRGERARVQFGGQPIAVGGQRIDHAHEFHVGHAGQLLRMEAAQAAGTDHCNAERHGGGAGSESRNSKSEYRNPKQIQSRNIERHKSAVLAFCIRLIRICFGFSPSDFGFRNCFLPCSPLPAPCSHAARRRSRPRPCIPSCWPCTKLKK